MCYHLFKISVYFEYGDIIIQLLHSFEVNIRICQPEKVMSTEAKPRITLLSRVSTEKECINCFVMRYCPPFSNIASSSFIFCSKSSQGALVRTSLY